MRNRNGIACRLQLCLAGIVAILSGCGDSRIPVHPVRGRVIVDGEPASGAKIGFISSDAEIRKLLPRATADEDGYFDMSTFEPSDGAPAGKYTVTVRWPALAEDGDPDNIDDEDARSGGDQLGGKYANPNESNLTVTVSAGKNDLETFELTREQ